MDVPDLSPAALGWLFAFALFTLVTLLAIAAQTALQHASRPRLRMLAEGRVAGANRALTMMDDSSPTPTLLLFLMLLGISGTTATVIAAVTTTGQFHPWEAGTIAVIAGATVLILAVVARALAAARPEVTALILGRPLWAAGAATLFVIAPLRGLERWVQRTVAAPRDAHSGQSDQGLRLLVETVEDARKLEEDEREMIHGIFGMSARQVREVMVPRIDVESVSLEATLGEVLDRIVSTGYSRIPIVEDGIDDVIGLVYAKDVLRALRAGKLDDPAAPLARKPYFVPDTKKVDELLQDLQQKRVHLAIVVDEYGGTAGLVSIEDLLEEIVGEIRDEYDDNEELPIQRISDRESVVDARVSIRDLNEELDLHLDVDELDTLGGLVYHELGKVPTVGDEVRVNGCVVSVLSTQGRRIKKLKVRTIDTGEA
jgi:putative hemolysin